MATNSTLTCAQSSLARKPGFKLKLSLGGPRPGDTLESTPTGTPPFALPRAKRATKRRIVGMYVE